MNRIFLILFVLSAIGTLHAIDVNPSRRVVPEDFTNPRGKKFSIFSGDPERVQRANEVKVQDFEGSLDLVKKNDSLAKLHQAIDKKPPLEVTFYVHNKANRAYTLSFPDAQRYDFVIKNSDSKTIYAWSEDKEFVKEVGKIFVNKDEKIAFTPNPPIEISSFIEKLKPGVYKVIATLSNYPEIKAEADWFLKP